MNLLRQVTTTKDKCFAERCFNSVCKESAGNTSAKMDLLKELPCEREVKWRGFGGCLNEAGIAALDTLSEQERSAILDELFLPDRMGLNYCRLPIGANDYALEWYSLDETENDYALNDFSIERDQQYVIRFAKEALARNPHIQFFASPWSPPSWMKEPAKYNGGQIKMTEKILSSYALYFVKYIQAYKKEGIRIVQVNPQNEWASDNVYPTCLWTGEQMRRFVADYLGPAFEKYGIDTEIWLGTINGTGTLGGFGSKYNEYTNIVLDDPRAYQYIKGVAYQWEGKAALRQSVESYPELNYIQSENECGDGENSWEYANYVFELMRHYITGGVCAYCYWNTILPKGGVSTWGWKQNSMITTENGRANFEYEYYVFRHAAAFVKKDARVLRLEGRMSGNSFGFENPDGTRVLVVQNPFGYSKTISFEGSTAELAPRSITTLVFGN